MYVCMYVCFYYACQLRKANASGLSEYLPLSKSDHTHTHTCTQLKMVRIKIKIIHLHGINKQMIIKAKKNRNGDFMRLPMVLGQEAELGSRVIATTVHKTGTLPQYTATELVLVVWG